MKKRVLLVADDFTGGNAAAAGYAAHGYRATTVMSDKFASFDEIPARFDVIVVSTGTRHASAVDAHRIVRDVVERSGRPAFVSLRIDSTLRGPIAASLHATLDALSESTGKRSVAICVPAHPHAGRQTINGRQLLDGFDISDSELARDALNPITSSSVMGAIAFEGKNSGHIALDIVNGHEAILRATLATMVDAYDVVAVDASTIEHIVAIADAATALSGDIELLAVDPGPFSLALANSRRQRVAATARHTSPILCVIGSPSELTVAQLDRLREERTTSTVKVEVDPSGGLRNAASALAALESAARESERGGIITLISHWEREAGTSVSVDAADRLVRAIATLASDFMERHSIAGIFCTGGDMTEALLTCLGARGVDAEDEALPLAVLGTVSGGSWDGLLLVTKGGMVGDGDSILRCVTKLENRIAEHHAALSPIVVGESNPLEEPHD